MLYVGVDDGHNEIKVQPGNGNPIRISSHAKAGTLNQISLSNNEATSFNYETNDGSYVAGKLREIDSTAFNDYPRSTLNRVLVMHALRQAGIDGSEDISVCTGLPIQHYYRGSKMNVELIKGKRKNLLLNDVVASDGTKLPKIVGHEIMAEGIAAYMDLALIRNADGVLEMSDDITNQNIAIIDIGGRTTDIAVIERGQLDLSRSSTLSVGMLAISKLLSEKIDEETGTVPGAQDIENALHTGVIKLWGDDQNIEHLLEDSKIDVVNRIKGECKRCLNNAADMDRVIFVGGTVMALNDLLKDWFRNQTICRDPAFANARGMQKYAEFCFGNK